MTAHTLAPSFSLRDHHDKLVDLDAQKGHPVVLFFYAGDLTSACTVQLSAVRDEWSKFSTAGAHVFGISQGTVASHLHFKASCGLPFPLLVDDGKRVAKKYGAIDTLKKTTIIRRMVVVIDRNQRIIYRKLGMPKITDILKHIS